jgi:ABC-type transporter Mla subunit MlaD
VILGLLVLLIVIGLLFAPHRHTGSDGYFKVAYSPSQAAGLSAGSPVILHRRQIGSVIATEFDGASVRVEFQVDPRLRYLIETTPAYVGHFRGHAYMRIGGPPPRPPSSQTSPPL